MTNYNLLSSVTLFGELYNSDSSKNIPKILADFIKGAIITKQKFSFNSRELKQILKDVYDFDIPESVLRTVLRRTLKNDVTLENHIFHFDKDKLEDFKDYDEKVKEIESEHTAITNRLYAFIEEKTNKTLNKEKRNKILIFFSNYLLDKDYSSEYSDLISGFIIKNELDKDFRTSLNSVKEGLILYQGISYTDNINELGHWNTNLTIYLSTENLFSAVGLNGDLYQEIFNDFFNLVIEINKNSKKSTSKIIHLKYFKETKDEVGRFFQIAESIKKGQIRLDPTNYAMSKIVKDCSSPREIKEKEIKLFDEIYRKGIEHKSFSIDPKKNKYNVVDESLVEELKEISEEKNMPFNEDNCYEILKIFTKVNSFRRGDNSFPFENIKHIYITEKGFANYLAHNKKVKFGKYDVPFSKDLDFITSKFWFKLQKGFKNKTALPKSFDITSKARIVLSGLLNSSLSNQYDRLYQNFKNNKLTEDQASKLNASYRDKPDAPENLNSDNIDDTLDFLFDDDKQERVLRDVTKKEEMLKNALTENKKLSDQLEELERNKRKKVLEESRKKYSENQWKNHRKLKKTEFNYFAKNSLFISFPIIIGIFLKNNNQLNEWMNSLGAYQWFIILALFLISLSAVIIPLILDKHKFKSGFQWAQIYLKQKQKTYKQDKLKEFYNQYKE